jgi:uncharacterized phage infection (PIP) family protein YhgE
MASSKSGRRIAVSSRIPTSYYSTKYNYMELKNSSLPFLNFASILLLACGADLGYAQTAEPSSPTAPNATPPKPNSPKDLEKKATGIMVKIQDLQSKTALAKKSLEIAIRPAKEREKDLDESIAIITAVLAEVSDGGEVYQKLQQAITASEGKLKEYKAKMSDPDASVKNQEAYMNLVNKFKTATDGLIKQRMAVTRERENVTAALKDAKDNRILFLDLVQADDLEAANAAVKEMVKSMVQVSESLSGIGTDLGKINPNALP